MFDSFVVGLGRCGAGLHLPALARAAHRDAERRLFTARPPVGYDPARAAAGGLAGAVPARSLRHAARLLRPEAAVVHLCTPPTRRVDLIAELAGLGFRRILVEKPLATDGAAAAGIAALGDRHALDLVVMAQWQESTLTHRIRRMVRGGGRGRVRAIRVVQRKPRFSRSLEAVGHPTAFDVELPHALGVVLDLAGPARVCDAGWTDMAAGRRVLPRLGRAWLVLEHDGGVRTELVSDLTAPIRERRIVVELDRATVIGHYPVSEADAYARLHELAPGGGWSATFHDDALAAYLWRAYAHFAGHAPLPPAALALGAEVVRLLDDAKRMSMAKEPGRALAGQAGRGVR